MLHYTNTEVIKTLKHMEQCCEILVFVPDGFDRIFQ